MKALKASIAVPFTAQLSFSRKPLDCIALRKSMERIEKALQLLGVEQCGHCERPMHRTDAKILGVCIDCWVDCEDLNEHIHIDVTDHDLCGIWHAHYFGEFLAGSGNQKRVQDAQPPLCWLICMSLVSFFGEDRIIKARSGNSRATSTLNPYALKYQQGVGLVPGGWNAESEPRTWAEWRKFWAKNPPIFPKSASGT